MKRAHAGKRTNTHISRAEKFGDLITADHKMLNEEGESRNNHRYAVIVQDSVTQGAHRHQCKTKKTSRDEHQGAPRL